MNAQTDYSTQRPVVESQFTTSDHTNLFYRYWPTEHITDKAIILFHRGHEHSGRVSHLVDELNLSDFAMFAWDARGHGRNEGPRGYSPSLGTSISDVDEFVHYVSEQYQIPFENIIVIGQSVGAVLVSAWVHDYAPKIRGMVLASPAFKVKLYVPFARTGLGLMQKLRGLFYVNSYVKAKFLTHDEQRIQSFNNDPLITRPIAVNILLELYTTADRIVADAAAITLPTQLFISGSDHVVHHKPQHQFYERLNTPIKEKHILSGFYHDTLGEKDRHIPIEKIRQFIDKLFALPLYQHDYQFEDTWSTSADAYRSLSVPLPEYCPKNIAYKIMSKSMSTLGKASEGVRIGYDKGFDSGSTLDYVYRNQAQGSGLFGRIIDRQYLNSIGWQGIRQRKVNIENIIRQAIRELSNSGKPVRIMDIAAGQGRYIFDAINDYGKVDSVLLRDYSPINVEQGRLHIKERYLEDKIRFEEGNAFDADDLAAVSPAPTLGIVSGLYELFPSNELIRASLDGLSRAIPSGGLLIYTCQPWHPQVEMIARVLPSHQGGKAWVMRCRSQGEMDALVEEAGFEKITQSIDNWGIFSVSLARRR
ncbi:bifunctional alpha/beta hydrolase/class I SAM-dependent methyltransferase [Providencia alcalifaciens]|uniref:bifunctional alpha/beta hydrolase/class I SAM-dependent methyltransferase n=1 Tax=Providencia alcalifaciens TaxID=126385 RepID=UPI00045067DA|nr:bifunctional alpha/beta hydrolase/class I SAM-dependent methyltransferase [Providencia alcalifaciens]ETT05132.1 methyltransferase, PF12147 family [Providencia alcalifaciens F90-2004]EUC94808.1 methyltransferase, PF12147 family [Providencia alcalifaciens PAL-2]EUD07674.1 methyltransferase, PF12147 family [Providencia alcalifaciens R90-1475]MTB33736.1 alpha/beta fold hydrolase [Providencia alcalifaciens]MTD00115.1 alpha/beta fold hydrolase [Providencia alcalifaciens]